MPGPPVLDDIELIIEDVYGNGGGKPPSRDGDDGGGDGGGSGGGEGQYRPRKTGGKKYSTAVALAMLSILVLFLVLAAAFLVSRFDSLHKWSGVKVPWILWANTAVLLASSGTLEMARRRLRMGDARRFHAMWTLTTFLGGIFIAGQVIAWRQLAAQGVFLTSRIASSFFYVITALHAAHVLGGIFALLYVSIRKFNSTQLTRIIAAEVTSYYWHFMDGLWLFLLALLYIGQ